MALHKRHTIYHKILRSSAVAFAVLLLFDSGLLTPLSKQFSDSTYLHLANVIAVGASVVPTELNTLTAEITAMQRDLDLREKNLKEREMAIGLNNASGNSLDVSTYVLSVILFILLVLITLNYALDFSRERKLARGKVAYE